MPETLIGVLLVLRVIVALCTMVLFVKIGQAEEAEAELHPWQYVAAGLAGCIGLTFLALIPFTWPG